MPFNRSIRLRVTGAALLFASGLSAVVTAGPAQAAYPTCDEWSYAETGNGTYKTTMPSLYENVKRNCELGRWLGGTFNDGTSALQRALNACYTQGLTVDGYYGPRTYEAVRRVQAMIGVRVDGGYGPITRDAMRWPISDRYARGAGCLEGRNLYDAGF